MLRRVRSNSPSRTSLRPSRLMRRVELAVRELEMQGLEGQLAVLQREIEVHALERQLLGLDRLPFECHSGVDRAELRDVERLVRQDVAVGLGCGRLLLLLLRGGLAGRGVGRRADQHPQIVEVQLLGREVGNQGRPLAGELEADVAREVAVADRAVQRHEVPALLVGLVGDLARKLVGRGCGQRQLQNVAERREIGTLEHGVDVETGQAQRTADVALGGEHRVLGAQRDLDRVGRVRMAQAVLGPGVDLEAQRPVAEFALAARVDHRHPVAQLERKVELVEHELRHLDVAGLELEVRVDRRQRLEIDVAVLDQGNRRRRRRSQRLRRRPPRRLRRPAADRPAAGGSNSSLALTNGRGRDRSTPSCPESSLSPTLAKAWFSCQRSPSRTSSPMTSSSGSCGAGTPSWRRSSVASALVASNSTWMPCRRSGCVDRRRTR